MSGAQNVGIVFSQEAQTHMVSTDIDRLDAGSWFAAEYAGECVPRLEVFLDACRGHIGACVQIKEGDPAEIRDMRGMLNDAWTISFDQAIRAETRAKVPDFRRMVLFSRVGSVDRAVAQDAYCLELGEENLIDHLVAEAKAANLVTQMFYAGEDRDVFEEAVRGGVDQMNIDFVELFREVERGDLSPAA